MAKTPPESVKISLRQRLNAHAKTRWPELARVEVRHRAGFAYVQGGAALGRLLDYNDPPPPPAVGAHLGLAAELCRITLAG